MLQPYRSSTKKASSYPAPYFLICVSSQTLHLRRILEDVRTLWNKLECIGRE